MTYVGSATSDQYDQELDTLLVGPIPVGVNKFIFEADSPDIKRIPDAEIVGVTVVLLTCSYDGREFVRVGYYVNNEYETEELAADPPVKPIIEKIRRNMLSDKPRVTRFAIKWYVSLLCEIGPACLQFSTTDQMANKFLYRDNDATAPAEFPPEQPEADINVEEEEYGAEELALEDEVEEATDANDGVAPNGGDDAMIGVAGEVEQVVDEDEMSEDGSVDLEGESEDEEEELQEEGAEEGAPDGDEMDVDMDAPEPEAHAQPELMAH